MFESFISVFKILNLQIFLLSILLFLVGYVIAPTAHYKKIKWLTAYPFFIIKIMDKYLKQDWHPVAIFGVVFILNIISLFLNLLSCWGVILPFIFAIYLGINIGIVMYHSLHGRYYYLGLFNPVALLELPAAWVSFTMAIQFSLTQYFSISFIDNIEFSEYVHYFINSVIPLLFIAGIIEVFLLKISKKYEDKNSKDN